MRGVIPDQGQASFGGPQRQAPTRFAPAAPVSCPQPKPDPACNLTYHNGPVVQTNTTYVVYWEPPGNGGVSANYHSLIQQYLTDAAADSNRATNVYAVDTQYYDNTGPGGSNKFLKYQQSFGGAFTDTTAFPATQSGCPLTDGTRTVSNCLSQTQLSTELDNFIQSNSLPRGLNNLYFLVLPKGVETCDDAFKSCGNILNTTPDRYCAYHSSFNISSHGLTIWANEPYIGIIDGHCNSGSASSPNGDDADFAINPLSHEHNEIITDPTSGGWFDVDGTGENGDKCNGNYGPNISSTASGGYNQIINHHAYEIQQEWSNAITGCTPNFGAVAPTAAFSNNPGSPNVNDSVTFDGSGSKSNDTGGYLIKYSWDFGDGQTDSSESLAGATPTTSHTYGSAGTYTVKLTITDDAGMTASVSHDVVVNPRPTTTTYTGPTNGDYNDPVTLTATLTDNGTSTGIANKTLDFTLGGEACSGTTNSSGQASCSVTPTDDPGPYNVTVVYGGDSTYARSTDTKPFTVNKEESKVTYNGAVTSHYHDPATVSATLTDPDGGDPIAGKTIVFTLGAGDTCSAKTDASGVAKCSITPTQAGTQTLTASFAGDIDYVSSSDGTSFAITPEETTMKYTGPTVILAGASGATLTATLLEDGSNDSDGDGGSAAPSPAEKVTLSLGSQSCTDTTNSSGNVSCTIPSVTVPLGPETVGASFAGDAYYQPSSDSTTAIVFAFPSRGVFTLGDKSAASATATTDLTWWSANWSQLNTLSGGAAPPAYKGFVDTVKLPTTSPVAPSACTPNWTSSPGNSSGPPSNVPSYMGTLLTKQVSKSGSQIAGNTIHIVVVKTGSGYEPNPGHDGIGRIVATFC
ncbi:MAG: Ig-like domain repeat protein [Solirubrobacteraceae bacterium]